MYIIELEYKNLWNLSNLNLIVNAFKQLYPYDNKHNWNQMIIHMSSNHFTFWIFGIPSPMFFLHIFFSNQLKTSRRAIFRGTGVKRVYKIILCGLTRNYILNIKDQNFSHQWPWPYQNDFKIRSWHILRS